MLVLLSGSAVALPAAADRIGGIVHAWYPGEAGGRAVADVLFGDYNPADRLPVTFCRSVADLPPFEDYRMCRCSCRTRTRPSARRRVRSRPSAVVAPHAPGLLAGRNRSDTLPGTGSGSLHANQRGPKHERADAVRDSGVAPESRKRAAGSARARGPARRRGDGRGRRADGDGHDRADRPDHQDRGAQGPDRKDLHLHVAGRVEHRPEQVQGGSDCNRHDLDHRNHRQGDPGAHLEDAVDETAIAGRRRYRRRSPRSKARP
ncbi:MAG: hypothetical protein FIB01_14960 [Gemmatimonadetes bacterium]|nr:hypothetical protein [Gemmatimonadota bacterium]